MRPLIAHEAPWALMPLVQVYTDYDYALVHLFEDADTEFAKGYFTFFKSSLEQGRKVILDNSIFELGESFNMEKFFDWVYKLKPTEYIIPDVLEDKDGTLENAKKWRDLVARKAKKGKKLSSKIIGVVQGKNKKELFECYLGLCELGVDKIAVSFDYSCYLKSWFQNSIVPSEFYYMWGRHEFVDDLIGAMRLDFVPKKPLHLLGCFLPQEFAYYKKKEYHEIESLDTSNPVVHGLSKIRYPDEGLDKKIMTKLVEFMKLPADELLQYSQDILYNINKFRTWAK